MWDFKGGSNMTSSTISLALVCNYPPSVWEYYKIRWPSIPGTRVQLLPYNKEGIEQAQRIAHRNRVVSAYVVRVEGEFASSQELLDAALEKVSSGNCHKIA